MGSNLIIEVNQQTEEILICDLSICEVLNKIPDNGGVIRERLKSISSYEIKNTEDNDLKIIKNEILDQNNNTIQLPKSKSKSNFNWMNLKLANFSIKSDSKFNKPEINIWLNGILNLFILIVLNLKYLNFRKF